MAYSLRSGTDWALVILIIFSTKIRFSLTQTSATDLSQTTSTTTLNYNDLIWSTATNLATPKENGVIITTSSNRPNHSGTEPVPTSINLDRFITNTIPPNNAMINTLTSNNVNGSLESSPTIEGVDAVTEILISTNIVSDYTSTDDDINGSSANTTPPNSIDINISTTNSGNSRSVTIKNSSEGVTDVERITDGVEDYGHVTQSTRLTTEGIENREHRGVQSTVKVFNATMNTVFLIGDQNVTISTTATDGPGGVEFTSTTGELSTLGGRASTESYDSYSGDSDYIWVSPTWKWDIILELIAAIIGIAGNFLVIVIIFSRRSSARSTDILIGNLAIADFLTSMAIIPYGKLGVISNNWKGMAWCLIFYQNVPFWWPVTASSYILMAISVERYIAVVYPMHFGSIVTVRRVRILIALIWFLALLSFLFGWFVTGVDEVYGCTLTLTNKRGLVAMGYYWFTIRIVVPVVTMLITQSLIAIELHRQSKNLRNVSTNSSFHLRARNRVLIIMLEIIIIYVVCWLPNQVAFLCAFVGYIEWAKYIGTPTHRALTVLGFFNSCLNPFIYAAQNPKFRAAIKDLFKGEAKKNSPVFSDPGSNSSGKQRYRTKDTASSV